MQKEEDPYKKLNGYHRHHHNKVIDHESNFSLDTASGSAHVERVESTWENLKDQRGTQSDPPADKRRRGSNTLSHEAALIRPLGRASRRRLLYQIETLQKERAALQSRLEATNAIRLKNRHETAAVLSSEHSSPSLHGKLGESSNPNYDATSFPSTFVSPSDGSAEDECEYLDQMMVLARKLRVALKPGASCESVKDEDFRLLDRPELRNMLLQAVPHPERVNNYAQIFAKRSLELYKTPRYRSAMLQAGPLQKLFRHPKYVDILAKCIREPFIAHMGNFDEKEFCLWLVLGTDYHTKDEVEEGDELDDVDLDDSCYEFSIEFMERFPFTGTKQLIDHTNVWRRLRGEEAIVQTKEMKEAEAYTNSLQLQAAALPPRHQDL